MSSFPRAARVLVALTLAGSATAFPPAASATDQMRSASRVRADAPMPTRKQLRQQARALARAQAAAAAAEAARLQAARAHALAVAVRQARLRQSKRVPTRAAIVFAKSRTSPFESRVTFRVWAKAGPRGKKK